MRRERLASQITAINRPTQRCKCLIKAAWGGAGAAGREGRTEAIMVRSGAGL